MWPAAMLVLSDAMEIRVHADLYGAHDAWVVLVRHRRVDGRYLHVAIRDERCGILERRQQIPENLHRGVGRPRVLQQCLAQNGVSPQGDTYFGNIPQELYLFPALARLGSRLTWRCGRLGTIDC